LLCTRFTAVYGYVYANVYLRLRLHYIWLVYAFYTRVCVTLYGWLRSLPVGFLHGCLRFGLRFKHVWFPFGLRCALTHVLARTHTRARLFTHFVWLLRLRDALHGLPHLRLHCGSLHRLFYGYHTVYAFTPFTFTFTRTFTTTRTTRLVLRYIYAALRVHGFAHFPVTRVYGSPLHRYTYVWFGCHVPICRLTTFVVPVGLHDGYTHLRHTITGFTVARTLRLVGWIFGYTHVYVYVCVLHTTLHAVYAVAYLRLVWFVGSPLHARRAFMRFTHRAHVLHFTLVYVYILPPHILHAPGYFGLFLGCYILRLHTHAAHTFPTHTVTHIYHILGSAHIHTVRFGFTLRFAVAALR